MKRTTGPLVCMGMLCGATICLGQTTYTATDLGKFSDAFSAYASAVNSSGRVVGGEAYNPSPWIAVLWAQPGAAVQTIVPASYSPGSYSWANGINDSGQIVGSFYDTSWNRWPYLYDSNAAAFQIIGTNLQGDATGINQQGTVVGYAAYAYTYDGNTVTWHPGPAPAPGYENSMAFAINNTGDIAGTVYGLTVDGNYHIVPAVFNAATASWTKITLPNGALSGYMMSINDNGWAVGYWMDSSYVAYPLVARKDGSTINLATPPTNSYLRLLAVNNAGLAVGTATVPPYGYTRALAYDITTNNWTDLSTKIMNREVLAWFNQALGISSDGRIAGSGFVSVASGGYEMHAFLLTPVISYKAFVQPPINSDGTSVFNARVGAVPVKFSLAQNNAITCALPPATIAVTRTAGRRIGTVDEVIYSMAADNGSKFRIDPSACQYIYNLSARAVGIGAYRVDILINGNVVGTAVFALN